MEIYLITGFLGSGKTTFLKNFVNLFKDKKIHLIINEFGKEGIDGLLVKELEAAISEINNGSIFCACRLDKFEDELNKIKLSKPEIVIVEASGLSDPTNVRIILDKPSYKDDFKYMGSICILDGLKFLKVVDTARVVPKQIKISTLSLINKMDLIDTNDYSKIVHKVKTINPATKIINTQFGEIEKEWLQYLNNEIEMEEAENKIDLTLQKGCVILKNNITRKKLNDILKIISEDSYRIKGFVNIEEKVQLINCVGNYTTIEKYNGEVKNINQLVVLAGEGMSLRKTFKVLKQWHGEYIEEIIL